MKIKEFSEKLGISPFTLRYYEKVGVLNPILRIKNGYREYSDADISWMEFVMRLKNTGMPILKIIEYANLRNIGDSTKEQRQKLLEEHEKTLINQIEIQKNNLIKIQEKIEFYKKR